MKKIFGLIGIVTVGVTLLGSKAEGQSNATPAGSFFGTVQNYFTSFNTNLDATFATERGSLWTSFDSIQGGRVPLANSLGLSYNVFKAISAESVTRNSGIAGTVLSEQVGLGLNFIVHDTKLTGYADGGYAFSEPSQKLYGEIGLRVVKALTEHTFAGVGIGLQVPANRQVLSASVGFTF